MPTAVTDRPAKLDPPRKLWTRPEFDRLSSSGLLDSQRLELIEGELIDKMGKKRAHVNSLTLLHAWLREIFSERASSIRRRPLMWRRKTIPPMSQNRISSF
jgi:hypothetical protein